MSPRCQQPTISAIHGYCLGGGLELALATDFRIADETAVFGFPEVSIGILPSSGGTVRAARLLGPARAKQLILLGGRLDADEALAAGLVTEVVAADGSLERALELAHVDRCPAAARRQRREAGDRRCARVLGRSGAPDRAARLRPARADDGCTRRRRRLRRGADVEHEKEIEIRWRDLDVYGHVNHVVFLTYLEEARDEWLGLTLGDPSRVWSYVVARIEIDYRRELRPRGRRRPGALHARPDRDVEHPHA